jgi:O-antigen/teichoic acid export membrane protein
MFFKNKRINNFIHLFSGSLFSQAINFVLYIFLARLYPQEAFGLYSLFISYMIFTSVLTNPQIPLLSLSLKDRESRDRIEELSESVVIWSFFLTIVVFTILWFLKISILGNYLLIVPFAAVLYTLTENRKIFSNQNEDFRQANLLTIIPRTSGNLIKIILIKLSQVQGLIWGEVCGNLYTFLKKLPSKKHSISLLIEEFKKRKTFLLFNYPATLSFVAFTELLPFFLISIYGVKTAGAYFLFEKFILQPFTLIGAAVGSSQSSYVTTLEKKI